MKRYLLSLLVLLASVAGMAQHPDWSNAPSTIDFPNSTPIYLKVNVLGSVGAVAQPQQVAAFVNGELRAVASDTNSNGHYTLRVVGDLATESGKPIEFRALYNNLEYVFTATESFDGETDTHSVPVEVTLNPLTDVQISNPVQIVAPSFPYDYDLTDDITLVYADEAATGSTLVTELTYSYEARGSVDWFEVNNQSVLTAKAETGTNSANLTLRVTGALSVTDATGLTSSYSKAVRTVVQIEKAVVSVESISVSPTEVTASIGDGIASIIRGLTVTVLPEDASNKDWSWQLDDADNAWVAMTNDAIIAAGTHRIKIYSLDNSEISTYLTVNVKTPLSFSLSTSEAECTTTSSTTVNVIVTGDDFDPSKVSFECEEAFNSDQSLWIANPSGDGKTWLFQGKYIGWYDASLYYDGEPVRDADGGGLFVAFSVKGDLNYKRGWNWISASSAEYNLLNDYDSDGYATWVQNDLIDLRSQEQLLYKDPTYGIFGDLDYMSCYSGGMYKLKAENDGTILLREQPDHGLYMDGLQKGYNWVTYPHEFDVTLEELVEYQNEADREITAAEGDMIIGKDAFATYSNGEWVHAAGFKLEAGKGYIYYSVNGGNTFDPAYYGIPASLSEANNPLLLDAAAPAKGARQASVWDYDASAYADNMAVIATIDGVDNVGDYSVGAFVGGECRGEGALAKGGVVFVNVAGNAGERVTFRLYNKQTGEYTAADGAVTYSAKAGTLQQPVQLTAPEATAVREVKAEEAAGSQTIYNLAGQRTGSLHKGINIVNGKKVLK